LAPITVGHPLTPKTRRQHLANAKPIHIRDDVWIGGNFTIGNNVTVAAGAVVTKDNPDNTLVAGVPATKIRDLENKI
jgi:maltose O-acetyltransferase